jgi:hypothetical protein
MGIAQNTAALATTAQISPAFFDMMFSFRTDSAFEPSLYQRQSPPLGNQERTLGRPIRAFAPLTVPTFFHKSVIAIPNCIGTLSPYLPDVEVQ